MSQQIPANRSGDFGSAGKPDMAGALEALGAGETAAEVALVGGAEVEAAQISVQWNLPAHARIIEVGLRDGLQAVPQPLATATKLDIVDRLIDAGLKEIEVASFAHPKVLPQLADAEELIDKLPRGNGVTYRGLVPNARGAQRAAKTALDEITFVIPAEDGMAVKNQGKTTAELLTELDEVVDHGKSAGMKVNVAVACAFFSPTYGEVSKSMRYQVIEQALSAAADSIYLATTTGEEHPREVFRGIAEVKADYPDVQCGMHLHNRNGFGLTNALAALSAGADWLESSFCALGGDMWFPGDPTVLGNLATEDLVHLLDGMGIETGIDLEKYVDLTEFVLSNVDFPRSSFVARGGTRKQLAAATWPE